MSKRMNMGIKKNCFFMTGLLYTYNPLLMKALIKNR